MVLPILISVAVTPGVSAAAAGTASAASAAAASQVLLAYMVSSPVAEQLKTDLARRALACQAGGARRDEAQAAGDPHRHRVDTGDEDNAIDRRRRGLRYLIGDVGHELDEDGAEQRARDRRDAADVDADEEADGQEDIVAVRRDELRQQSAERAGDAGEQGGDAESERFVER